jgi:hypothetical protein
VVRERQGADQGEQQAGQANAGDPRQRQLRQREALAGKGAPVGVGNGGIRNPGQPGADAQGQAAIAHDEVRLGFAQHLQVFLHVVP